MEIPEGFFKSVPQQIKELLHQKESYEMTLRENWSDSLYEDIKDLKETIRELESEIRSMNPIQRYNFLASQFGWLPVNISESDSRQVIRDAAERANGCFPEVSEGLREIKGEKKDEIESL